MSWRDALAALAGLLLGTGAAALVLGAPVVALVALGAGVLALGAVARDEELERRLERDAERDRVHVL